MKRYALMVIGFVVPYLVAWVSGAEIFARGDMQAITLIVALYIVWGIYLALFTGVDE